MTAVEKSTEALQKFSVDIIDGLEWEVMTEMPDFCVVNGEPTMKWSVMSGDGVSTGTIAAWSCDKDGFTYHSIPAAEAAFLLEGVARLTDADTGEVTVVTAGQGYRLPVGWSGRWEALEPVRKIYLFL
jgi:uncharacterized cupin superfamily protein